ncbi:MAG: nicotinate-nucleotide adenylyltransferase [Gammaproteobacteria bacterium]|nr:nicotinate-nucleotide adenylyltransferase [Gammaproteobacteria bacterium]
MNKPGPHSSTKTDSLGPLVGIYGGTFDPIHFGHINTVASVASQTGLKSVFFIPSAIPPHRPQPQANAQHRLEMTCIAIDGHPQFNIDDRELRRQNPSYMVDTVFSLKSENPENRYCLILGMDALLGLEQWHRWQSLLDQLHFIVMQRPGWSEPSTLPEWWRNRQAETFRQLQLSKAGRIYPIKIDPIDISATDIRNRLKKGKDVSQLIPDGVHRYICENQLYE